MWIFITELFFFCVKFRAWLSVWKFLSRGGFYTARQACEDLISQFMDLGFMDLGKKHLDLETHGWIVSQFTSTILMVCKRAALLVVGRKKKM